MKNMNCRVRVSRRFDRYLRPPLLPPGINEGHGE
jgi:hypothetical protein